MNASGWKRRAREGLCALAIVVPLLALAPTDLIHVRGAVLRGIVGRYSMDQWQVTTSGLSNIQTAAFDPGGNANAVASSTVTSALGAVGITAPTGTSALTGSAEVGYGGSWNFQWLPANSTDWPPDTTITSVHHESYHAMVSNGTGSVTITDANTSTQLAKAYLPNMGESLDDNPGTTITTDTSDPNVTITTTTSYVHHTSSSSTDMTDVIEKVVLVRRAYTAAWFTANFTTPYDVLMTYPVTSTDVSSSVSFTSSGSGQAASSSTGLVDTFTFE